MGSGGSKNKRAQTNSTNNNTYHSTSTTSNVNTHTSNSSTATTTTAQNTNTTSKSTTTSNTSTKNQLEALFEQYQKVDDHSGEIGENAEYVGGDGIMALCNDVQIDAMDVVVLMLMHKLNCKQQFRITRSEWMEGFKSLYITSLEDMKTKIPQIKTTLNSNPKQFKQFYTWCFAFLKEPDQKGMSVEVACQSWPVVLSNKYKHLEDWCNFIQVEVGKAVQKDTWDLFYDFVTNVGNDFNDYNEDGAWPVAIDEFVAWMKEGKNVAVREKLAKEREAAEQQQEEQEQQQQNSDEQ